jgi:hypothetical protein
MLHTADSDSFRGDYFLLWHHGLQLSTPGQQGLDVSTNNMTGNILNNFRQQHNQADTRPGERTMVEISIYSTCAPDSL